MRTKHKINAYTLSEMIVVIIITTIVVGMAFSVLSMVQKYMKGIQVNFSRNLELDKLEQSFNLDFNRFSDIRYDPLKDELRFSSGMDSITYSFSENYLITPLDSLNVQFQNKAFYFDGEVVSEGKVDAIKLTTSKEMLSQALFVYKRNDAVSFMN